MATMCLQQLDSVSTPLLLTSVTEGEQLLGFRERNVVVFFWFNLAPNVFLKCKQLSQSSSSSSSELSWVALAQCSVL